jgi:uncharacterized protein (TIGR03382 family)
MVPIVQHVYGLTTGSLVMPTLTVVDDSGRLDRVRSTAILTRPGPDLANPTLAIDTPTSAPTWSTTASTVTLGGPFGDDLGIYGGRWHSDRVTVAGNNLFLAGTSGRWSIVDLPLLEGLNLITVEVEDYPGKLATVAIAVTRLSADGGAGQPVVDAGQPVVDAGQPVVDAGQPVVDAGQPVVDAGQPVVDAGGTVVDAGQPVVDAGGTGSDAGPQPADAGMTGADGGLGTEPFVGGCGCTSGWSGLAPIGLLLAFLWRRRARALVLLLGLLLPGVATAQALAPAAWRERHVALWAHYAARAPTIDAEALRLLHDEDPRNRRAAAEILGLLGRKKPAVSRALEERLRDDDAHVRDAALTSLGTCGDASSAEVLRQFRAVSTAELRRRAALVSLGDPVEAAALETDLGSTTSLVRADATTILGLAGGAQRARRLLTLLGDDAPTGRWLRRGEVPEEGPQRVRHVAAEALEHLLSRPGVELDPKAFAPALLDAGRLTH